jgi:hypothetical protein
MTAKDEPKPGAEQPDFDYDKITSLSADGCARPGGRDNYTPPPPRDGGGVDMGSGFAGYDDDAAAPAGNAPEKFKDTGFDGYDDDAKGPATIDLISRIKGGVDGGEDDDRPAA